MNRWILTASLVGLALPVSADWYFRGTPNSWAATALTLQSGTTYTSCQSFTSGDSTGGPRFKIDRKGDWSESYPSADYTVSANTSYLISSSTAAARPSASVPSAAALKAKRAVISRP